MTKQTVPEVFSKIHKFIDDNKELIDYAQNYRPGESFNFKDIEYCNTKVYEKGNVVLNLPELIK